MRLGRLVLIDIEGEYSGLFDKGDREEFYLLFAGGESDKDGKLTHLFFMPSSASEIVKTYKDDVLFKEELEIEVYALDGKEIKEKLYSFDGTLLDCLEIASKEGLKYDKWLDVF